MNIFKNLNFSNFPCFKLNYKLKRDSISLVFLKLTNYRFCQNISQNGTKRVKTIYKKSIYHNDLKDTENISKLKEKTNSSQPTKNTITNKNNISQLKDSALKNENSKSNEKFYKGEKMDEIHKEFIDRMSSFNKDFSRISPVDENNNFKPKDELELETFRRLSRVLGNNKVREKGSEYLIDLLIDMYKQIAGYDQNSSYENYIHQVNKIDTQTEHKIKEIFSKNEVIETISIILKHISDLKESELEKFINILIKIQYSNFDNWKIILRQYILYISLLDSNYQPLRDKDICQILHHLKNMYNFLPYTSDEEIQSLLERSIKDSVNYLIKKFDGLKIEFYGKTLTAISKLGLLDDEICRKVESNLIYKLKDHMIPGDVFANILFCIIRNRCASENLLKHLANYCDKIINSYLKDPELVDPYVLSLISKSLYYGYKLGDKTLYANIEEVLLQNKNKFEVHQIVIIAHSLCKLFRPSNTFFNSLETYFKNFNQLEKLTELLTFQIITVLLKNNHFSLDNIRKYINFYKIFIEKNQVKRKQIETFKSIITAKINKEFTKADVAEYLKEIKNEMNDYDFSFKKYKRNQ